MIVFGERRFDDELALLCSPQPLAPDEFIDPFLNTLNHGRRLLPIFRPGKRKAGLTRPNVDLLNCKGRRNYLFSGRSADFMPVLQYLTNYYRIDSRSAEFQ